MKRSSDRHIRVALMRLRRWRHSGGSVAILTAILIVPLTFALGMAYDYTMASNRKDQIDGMADAAALGRGDARDDGTVFHGRPDAVEELVRRSGRDRLGRDRSARRRQRHRHRHPAGRNHHPQCEHHLQGDVAERVRGHPGATGLPDRRQFVRDVGRRAEHRLLPVAGRLAVDGDRRDPDGHQYDGVAYESAERRMRVRVP
ncbi:MAG: pilus assembly protein TadG-related protein [Caulobacteraceae bacterium]